MRKITKIILITAITPAITFAMEIVEIERATIGMSQGTEMSQKAKCCDKKGSKSEERKQGKYCDKADKKGKNCDKKSKQRKGMATPEPIEPQEALGNAVPQATPGLMILEKQRMRNQRQAKAGERQNRMKPPLKDKRFKKNKIDKVKLKYMRKLNNIERCVLNVDDFKDLKECNIQINNLSRFTNKAMKRAKQHKGRF